MCWLTSPPRPSRLAEVHEAIVAELVRQRGQRGCREGGHSRRWRALSAGEAFDRVVADLKVKAESGPLRRPR